MPAATKGGVDGAVYTAKHDQAAIVIQRSFRSYKGNKLAHIALLKFKFQRAGVRIKTQLREADRLRLERLDAENKSFEKYKIGFNERFLPTGEASKNYFLGEDGKKEVKHRVATQPVLDKKQVKDVVTLTHLAPHIRKTRLHPGNLMNNMYVDVKIHGIKNVELEHQTYEADLKIEVHWTDDSDWTKKREADYAELKAFILKENENNPNFKTDIPNQRVDYKKWGDGRPQRESSNESFGGLFYDVRDIVHNYNEKEDVFKPYLTHYMDPNRGPGKVRGVGNVRVLFRQKCTLKMGVIDLENFPYDSLQLPVELRYNAPNVRLVMQQYRGSKMLGVMGKKWPHSLKKSAEDAGETIENMNQSLLNIGYCEDEVYDMAKRIEAMKKFKTQISSNEDGGGDGCWKRSATPKDPFSNFQAVLEWEDEQLKHLVDAEDGLIFENLKLMGWHGLHDEAPLRKTFFKSEIKPANAVARAEYKKMDKTFRSRKPFQKDSPSADEIEMSSKLQVHKTQGLGHLEFHLTVDRNPTYFVNIARATFFITLFGVYTGAMAIDQVEGRGTVSFVLGLTVITFKYSVMTGDHTPMPPALLEETDLDNFMDTGFNVLIIIIMENLICGFLLQLSDNESGNPNLFNINWEIMRITDLIFYACITLFWFIYSFVFFIWRHRSQKKKQLQRNEEEKKPPLVINDTHDKRVAEYYQVTDVMGGTSGDEANLRRLLSPSNVFEGDHLSKPILPLFKSKKFSNAGPSCQDFPFTLSFETIRNAHRSWKMAESRRPGKEDTVLPAWSDESTLEYLLFAVRAAHLPGTFYKEIALRLFSRMYVDGPYDGGHTVEEVLGMIQYETKKNSDGMNKCLMRFALNQRLNPKFDDIKLEGSESWTDPASERSNLIKLLSDRPKTLVTKTMRNNKSVQLHDMDQKRHQLECIPLFDNEDDTFYPEVNGKREDALFGNLQLGSDTSLIYFTTVLAAYFGSDKDAKTVGKFDEDLAFLQNVGAERGNAKDKSIKHHTGIAGKTFQRINNKNASDYKGKEYKGFKTGHTKDPIRNAFEVDDGQDDGSSNDREERLGAAVDKIKIMWDKMKAESENPTGVFQVVGVKNNYMMDPNVVRDAYEGMHQLLINIVYTPRAEKGARRYTFQDIFKDKNGLKKAFKKARDQNTSPHGGEHLADGKKYDAMESELKTLYEDYEDSQKSAQTARKKNRQQTAFSHLMKTKFALICETQIHLKWFFTRRKLTHLWFKANRATSLSMLKYDSYGWIERPTEREFEAMLDRQKEHSWKTGGGAAAAEEEADADADAGGESSATAAIVANPVYNVDYSDNNGDLSI